MNPSLLTGLLLGTLLKSGPAFSQNATYRYPFAKGAIARLDAAAKLITISTADGSQTFVVTDRTYLFRGPDKITLAKLRIGEIVKINYYTNETGQALVRRLKVDVPALAEENHRP